MEKRNLKKRKRNKQKVEFLINLCITIALIEGRN